MAVSCIAFSQPISPEIKNSDSLNIAFQEKMEDMFENVDLSLVPNGILYDHGLLYASLTSMAVDTNSALPATKEMNFLFS